MKLSRNIFFVVKHVLKIVPFYFICSIITIFLNAILSWGQLYIIEHTIEMVMDESSHFIDVFIFIISLSSLNIFCSSLDRFYQNYLRPRFRHTWMKKIQRKLYEKVKDLPIEYYDEPHKYDQLSRALKQDLSSINVFDRLIDFVVKLFSMIVMVVYICVNVPILFVITLLASTVNFICSYQENKMATFIK